MNYSLYLILAMTAIFALSMVIGVCAGFKKSLPKMIVKLSLIVGAMAVAIIIVHVAWPIASPKIYELAKAQVEQLAELSNASPALKAYLLNLVGAIVKPLAFWLLFIILLLIFKLIAFIVFAIIGKKGVQKRGGLATKIVNVSLGVVAALVFCYCFFLPFTAYTNFADKVGASVISVTEQTSAKGQAADGNTENGEKSEGTGNELADQILGEVNKFVNNGLEKLHFACSKPLISLVTTFKDDEGNRSSLFAETDTLVKIAEAAPALTTMNFEDVGNIDVEPMNALIDAVSGSRQLKRILSELLATASTKWSNGETFLNVNLTEGIDPDLAPAINVILADLKVTTTDKIEVDLRNLTSLLKSVSSVYKAISGLNFDDITDIDPTVLNEAIDEISASVKLEQVIAALLTTAGEKWGNGEAFLGIDIASSLPAEFKGAMGVVFARFAATNEEKVTGDLRDFSSSLTVLGDVYETIQSLDFSDVTNINLDVFDGFVEKIESQDLILEATAALLSDAGTAWQNGEDFFGGNPVHSLPSEFSGVLDPSIDRFANTNKTTVATDLRSFIGTVGALKYAYEMAGDGGLQTLDGDLNKFLSAITPETAEMVKGVLSPEIMEAAGISAENSQAASEIVDKVIDKVSVLSDEQKQKEAEALNDVFSFISGDSSDSTAERATAEDVVASVAASAAVSEALKDYAEGSEGGGLTLDEGAKNELGAAIEGYEPATDEERETLESLKKLFGIV